MVLTIFLWPLSPILSSPIEINDNVLLKKLQTERLGQSQNFTNKNNAKKISADNFQEKRDVKKEQKLNYVEGEVLVKFKEQKINLEQFSGRTKAQQFAVSKNLDKKEDIRKSNISVLKIKDSKTVEEKIAELKNDSSVEYVQPNFQYYPLTVNPNLWGLNNTGQSVNGISGTDDADIDAPEAWAISEGEGSDIIVAVIDDGVAYNHPYLADNMWDGIGCSGSDKNGNPLSGNCLHGYDYEDNDLDPLPTSGSHGTHIAGTIGAVKNDGGIIGVAPNVKIMALKVDFTTDQILMAIDFAKNNNAKIINASWGGQSNDPLLKAGIENFTGLFIVAAGNESTNNDSGIHNYPSDYDLDNIISVAATDQNDDLWEHSNYGIDSVDVGAPGVNIYSTISNEIFSDVLNETFEEVAPSNIPSDWTMEGDNNNWGTYDTESSAWGNVLYGDLAVPYANNINSTVTSPTYDLNSKETNISFWTKCDTSYHMNSEGSIFQDYMSLEISADGDSYLEIKRWNEFSIDIENDSGEDSAGSAVKQYDLSIPIDYLTDNFKFRFRWVTDSADNNYDGCLIDDIKITKIIYTDGLEEQYGYMSGTSMATPHVAGLAALIWGYKSELSYSEIKDVILETGDELSDLDGKTTTGKRINAFNALNSLTSFETEVSGNITEDTTWTLENSPYIVTDTVQVYAALTIESGVEVRFNTDAGLTIGGELNAIGTEDQKIIFTSNNDNPSVGDWEEIRFIDASVDALLDDDENYLSGSIIKYCQIEYAYSAMIVEDSSPYIDNNIVRYGRRGVFVSHSNSVIKNNTIYDINHLPLDLSGNLGWGIFSWEGNPVVIDNEIKNCSGGYSGGSGTLVAGNVIKDNIIGTNGPSIIKQNTITGNNTGIIASGGIVSENIISGNETGILTGEYKYLQLSVSKNNIFDNSDYNIKVRTSADIDAINNYWGTIDTSIIDEKIYDREDDINLGKVIYEPFVTAEIDFDDQTAPVVEITSPENGLITNQSITTIEYTIDGIAYSDDEILVEGENIVIRSGTDEVGNIGSSSIIIILDTTPPTGYTVDIDQDYINNNDQNKLSFTFTDAETGATYDYSIEHINGSPVPVVGNGIVNSETDQITDIDVSALDDGELVLFVYLTDTIGNQGHEMMNSAVKDTIIPIVIITSPEDGLITNQSTTTIEYTIDGTAYSDDEVLVEGENIIVKESMDEAGNVGSSSIAIILDITPPTQDNGLPTGALSAGTVETTLSLATNENAVCRYATSTDMEYGIMTNIFDITGSTTHSILITGLSDGNSYFYYVKCQDELDNANTDDYEISFSISNCGNGTCDENETCSNCSTDCGSCPSSSSGGGGGGGSAPPADKTPPAQPADFTANRENEKIILTWKNPNDSDFDKVLIVKSNESIANDLSIDDLKKKGEIIYEGNDEQYNDEDINNNATYYYAIVAYDKKLNYTKPLIIQTMPKISEGQTVSKTSKEKVVVLGIESDYRTIQINKILSEAKYIFSGDANSAAQNRNKQRNENEENEIHNKYVARLIKGINGLMQSNITAFTNFILYGTETADILGAGERAGVINSYKSAFNKLPTTESEWQDAIKIANGRWPSEKSETAENNAKKEFKKVYKREANMENPNDNAAVTVIAYGLRPDLRNLDSEKTGIKTFKHIYGYNPSSAIDWDIVRAIAYSGATR